MERGGEGRLGSSQAIAMRLKRMGKIIMCVDFTTCADAGVHGVGDLGVM